MRPTIGRLFLVLTCATGSAIAADTGQLPCATTAECNREAARIGAAPAALGASATSKTDQAEDQFYWLNKINRASAVMLVEEKIVPADLGQKLARGVNFTIEQATKPDGKRPSDVLQIEKIIAEQIGPDASFIHTGRSRQDMYATYRMAKLRNELLDFSDALNGMRARVLALAAKNVNTIVPAYTNGVQAQPISFAHYLLGYEASFARDAERIHDIYQRLNRCAMGTAVLANSIWPLNRKRMADLLGFDGIIENAIDAGQISPSDVALEASAIVSSNAIRLGAVLNDIHTQYHQTRPWLLLEEGSTYTSSSMPQKRNPGLIMRAREEASDVVGLSETVTLRAHNVTTGMTDYKSPWAEIGLFAHAVNMIGDFDRVLDALVVNPARSLEELEDDWTTSMELAETLQKEHQIPFRVGHRFASSIVSFARANELKPSSFPYAKATELYASAIREFKLPDDRLPIDEAAFRKVLSPEFMVKTRVGIGGPQPAETERQLGEARATLEADGRWMETARQKIGNADTRLDTAFRQLLTR
jgi:argininosuccinate lyase